MEYKIGETFEFNGKKLRCVLNNGLTNVCEKCALYKTNCYTIELACTPKCREDLNDVYFIEIKEENNMSSRKLNNNEDVKEQIITPPEGYEVDIKNSTFKCIKFKKKEKVAWRSVFKCGLMGYSMHTDGNVGMIVDKSHDLEHTCVFATEKQAKSAQAMAIISQIMANDERFGGVVTDEEWRNDNITKYIIFRDIDKIKFCFFKSTYYFLAFHTEKQRDLFLKENKDLIKDYLMID